MVDKQEQYPAEIVCGITKKIGMELEKLPLETHQAVVSMIAQLFQHRGLAEQNRMEREKLQHAEVREKREAQQAKELAEHIERSRHARPVPDDVNTGEVRNGPIEIPAGASL